MSANPMVAPGYTGPDRRRGDRRTPWLEIVDTPNGFMENFSERRVFPTTHAKARCEMQLVEVQAASGAAVDSIDAAIRQAQRTLDELREALRAAKAADDAGYRAARQITETR